MSAALAVVTVGFAIFIAFPAMYLGLLAAVTVIRTRAPRRTAVPPRPPRIAILVPAHDEAALIGGTVAGLLRLEYPPGLFSVHVGADNSSDATAAGARRSGACVHERDDPRRRGKGATLNWLVQEVTSESPDVDAFVVVDADSELSGDFLWVMARELASGAEVAQALNLVAADDRPLVRIRELAFELMCHLRPLAYELLGGSSTLHGNGMCFAASLFPRYRWSEASVVEDSELFLRLVRDGHRIALAAGATVRSRMPATLREARAQALRWERSRLDHPLEALRLAGRGLRRRDPSRLLAGLAVLIPPIAVLAVVSLLGFLAGAIAGVHALTALAAGALVALLLYGLRGASLGGMTPHTLLRILMWAPPYLVWKLWVVGLAVSGAGRQTWSRASRTA